MTETAALFASFVPDRLGGADDDLFFRRPPTRFARLAHELDEIRARDERHRLVHGELERGLRKLARGKTDAFVGIAVRDRFRELAHRRRADLVDLPPPALEQDRLADLGQLEIVAA